MKNEGQGEFGHFVVSLWVGLAWSWENQRMKPKSKVRHLLVHTGKETLTRRRWCCFLPVRPCCRFLHLVPLRAIQDAPRCQLALLPLNRESERKYHENRREGCSPSDSGVFRRAFSWPRCRFLNTMNTLFLQSYQAPRLSISTKGTRLCHLSLL